MVIFKCSNTIVCVVCPGGSSLSFLTMIEICYGLRLGFRGHCSYPLTQFFLQFMDCIHPSFNVQGEWISPELDENGKPPDLIAIGLQVVLLFN